MRIDIKISKREKGQAAVEGLMIIMILALIVFSGIELSRGVAIRSALDSGAGAGVRALSLDPGQWSFTNNLVQEAVNQNVMGGGTTVTLSVLDASGTTRSADWLDDQAFGTAFVLQASAPFQADIPFLSPDGITITVRHWGIVERYP